MIVRLHNLAARPPVVDDVEAVTELIAACERADAGIVAVSEEEVENRWHESGFTLRTDAWVIVTKRGQIVGYADVRQSGGYQLTSLLRVHPDYLDRGIGTLLVWLTEERARDLMRAFPVEQSVTLINCVCSLNERSQHLFEREGYTLARHYWSVNMREDEERNQSCAASYQSKRLQFDLSIDAQNFMGTPSRVVRTGIYVMHQYYVFEKELRAGVRIQQVVTQCIGA
jgi:N-acetylglutamate synthase-like GNAT family acetyltransferase